MSKVEGKSGQKTLLRQSEKHIHESSIHRDDSYKLLVESVQDYAIFMISPKGTIESWNLGARRIKGYNASEIIGKNFSLFYTEEDAESRKPQKLLELATLNGRVEDEGWRVRKDGSKFWADVIITALFDTDGSLRGFAKVTRDLTERQRTDELKIAFQEMEDMVKDLNKINKQLSDANMNLAGREYKIRALEYEIKLLKIRLELAPPI